MNNKLEYLILFLVLLIFCMSYVNATNNVTNLNFESSKTTVEPDKIISKQSETNIVKNEVISQVDDYTVLASKLDDKQPVETINLKNTTYKITNPVTMKYRNISKNVVINGNGAIIDGQNQKSFLTIAPNHNVTINDLIIENTNGTSQAGAIVVSSNASLTLNNCIFTNDISSGKGGALTNRGTTIINNSIFQSNTAFHGGVIWSTGEYGGSLKIENSKFISNKASYVDDYERTAIVYLVSGGNVNIINNTFEDTDGGSIHNFGTNLTIAQNIFKNINLDTSKVTIRGAIIDNYEAPVNITNNTFENIELFVENIRGGILYNEIGTSTFTNNKISNLEIFSTAQGDSLNGGILFNRNSTLTVNNNVFDNVNNGYRVHGGALYNNIGILNVTNNTFNIKNTATLEIRGGAIYNDKDNDLISQLYYSENNFDNIKNNGPINGEIIYNVGIAKDMEDYPIKATKITVDDIKGAVGDYITFKANIRDTDGNPVTGGNLVFKVNGKTLKVDGTFNTLSEVYKVNVTNGIAQATILTTKAIRGAKTISATYSGTKKYYANTSYVDANAEILLRDASIKLNVSPSTQKQYETIKFIAEITDITNKNQLTKVSDNNESYVFFKVNGVTLKDTKGNIIKAKVTNGVATYNYVVPAGMSAIGKDKKVRYYNVTVGYVNPDYYPDTKDTTHFNILRSNITIQSIQTKLDLKQHKLTINATIKDYKNNNVIGTNKISIKINGKTMKINNQTTTDVMNGTISITITLPSNVNNIKNMEIVTGARTAYEGTRVTLTSFN